MRIVGDKIVLSKKETGVWKQIYEEIPCIDGERLDRADLRVKRYCELIKENK